MALTTLDSKTALIVVDLQKGLLSYPTTVPLNDIIEKARQLAQAFRQLSLPVVLVTAAGIAPGRTEQTMRMGDLPADFADVVPQLNPQASDHKVTKKTWGAFVNTDLDNYLKSAGATQVVVVGVATSIGVESTARQAYEYGYNVTIATDAMTDLNPEAHSNSIVRIFPRLGETGTTQEILDLLKTTHESGSSPTGS